MTKETAPLGPKGYPLYKTILPRLADLANRFKTNRGSQNEEIKKFTPNEIRETSHKTKIEANKLPDTELETLI